MTKIKHAPTVLTYHKSDRRSIDQIWELTDTLRFTVNVSHDPQIRRYVVTVYRSELIKNAGYTVNRTVMHDPLNLRWTIVPERRYSFADLCKLSESVLEDERVLSNLALAIAELQGEELCDECGIVHDPDEIVTVYGVSND